MARIHPEIGCNVVYVSSLGVPHAALVQAVWGGPEAPDQPALNLAYVSIDTEMKDFNGRALFRVSSVVHKSLQSAPGNYWAWQEDL